MNCDDFINPSTTSIRDQMHNLSGDEWLVFNSFRENGVLTPESVGVGRTTLYEMYCKGWLLRAEFADGTAAYKVIPSVMDEWRQYEREQGS